MGSMYPNNSPSPRDWNRKSHLEGMIHMLNRIHWQFFFHLTFKKAVDELTAKKAYKGFATKVTRAFLGRNKIVRNRLLHFAQIEFGSSSEHIHLHGCLAGLPQHITAADIEEIWETRIHEGGNAEVSEYDTRQNGVSYALKIWENPQEVALMQSAESWPIYPKSIEECLRRRGER